MSEENQQQVLTLTQVLTESHAPLNTTQDNEPTHLNETNLWFSWNKKTYMVFPGWSVRKQHTSPQTSWCSELVFPGAPHSVLVCKLTSHFFHRWTEFLGSDCQPSFLQTAAHLWSADLCPHSPGKSPTLSASTNTHKDIDSLKCSKGTGHGFSLNSFQPDKLNFKFV